MKPTELVKGRNYRINVHFGDYVVGRFLERIDRTKSFFVVDDYKGAACLLQSNGACRDGKKPA